MHGLYAQMVGADADNMIMRSATRICSPGSYKARCQATCHTFNKVARHLFSFVHSPSFRSHPERQLNIYLGAQSTLLPQPSIRLHHRVNVCMTSVDISLIECSFIFILPRMCCQISHHSVSVAAQSSYISASLILEPSPQYNIVYRNPKSWLKLTWLIESCMTYVSSNHRKATVNLNVMSHDCQTSH